MLVVDGSTSRGHGQWGGSRCWLLMGVRVGGMGDGEV